MAKGPRGGQPSGGARPAPELEALRSALQGLRQDIRTRFPVAEPAAAASSGSEIDLIALFDELRRRAGSGWMAERMADVDEFGMDAQMLERTRELVDFLYDRYFRVSISGIDHVPVDGPCLFVANRSGLLPYDGFMLAEGLRRHHPRNHRPRFMVADWLVTLPFAQPALARMGGVRACRENTDRLLRTGHSVIAFPEGVKGAAKVFRERYRIKRFGRGGVVRAALENRVPLVPVGIVGAEEAHPILFKAHRAARVMGLPFVPVTPTFPWLGPAGLLPLPTKWVIGIGAPIGLDGFEHGRPPDAVLVSRINEELRGQVQQLVNDGLDRRPSVWE